MRKIFRISFELLHYKQHRFHPLPIRQVAPVVLEAKSDFRVQIVDGPLMEISSPRIIDNIFSNVLGSSNNFSK